MRRYEPKELAPMTCRSVERVCELDGEVTDWLCNPKLDGYRLVCAVEEGKVSMMSRGEKWQDGKLPYLEEALLRRFPVGTVLDGEICALRDGGDGEPTVVNDFEHVQSIMNSLPEKAVAKAEASRPLTYHCFDMMQYGDHDLRREPLTTRLTWLNEVARDNRPVEDDHLFQRTPYIEATQEHHDAWVQAGFEGTVLKRKDSTYQVGKRGKGWVKIKHTAEIDVIIVGFMPGQGRLKGQVGSTVFAQRTTDPEMLKKSTAYITKLRKDAVKRGGEFYIAAELVEELGLAVRGCCSGYSDDERGDLNGSIGRVISIHHNGLMAGGLKVRHPQFFRDREDKSAQEVHWHSR